MHRTIRNAAPNPAIIIYIYRDYKGDYVCSLSTTTSLFIINATRSKSLIPKKDDMNPFGLKISNSMMLLNYFMYI